MKWVEGSIGSFIEGRTPLNMVLGRIRKAVESYGIRPDEVKEIINIIEASPLYLPGLKREEKAKRLQPLREALEEGR